MPLGTNNPALEMGVIFSPTVSPGSLSKFQSAVRAIRAWEKAQGRIPTPMLAVSANATDEHVIEAKDAGADDHVANPLVREILFEAIARAVVCTDRSDLP